MEVFIKSFNDYSTLELYNVMQLRSEVFVVEQDCVYQDLDGKDKEAIHILGYKDQELAAYTRIFKPGDYFEKASIGRVVVSPKMRGLAYGQKIMTASIDYCKDQGYPSIQISAQCYLHKFYTDLGFVSQGEKYLEDGIPHQEMVYTF
ncbi:ElaA protein [Nonlabens xylanidelens]|uniref:ElaA protein n=1 Tax=Nonlabens xylanidelens TaxID=191564 RepID=A0A2S6IQZ9_9FLAO|nr:GNAT family N-acetyltransferase [Nonlabens xylanidelens]PPK96667.1 ElaA protein [Nonlabens xylanidelens]PQJ13382.1 GNAT family N-acetyltransferase [Nonlabens xylanidelens]